jgi:hypothetical protein
MNVINKYNTAMIYTIRSPYTEQYYIGSTTQILCRRFSDHKMNYKDYLDKTSNFITSFKILELGDAYIELLEDVNCENRNQLEKREGELIRLHKNNCVNKNIAGRTDKQYRLDNKDKAVQYKIDNKDKIVKQIKQYYNDNKESISEYKKQYRLDNVEKIKEKDKQYYNDNKEYLSTQHKQYRNDNTDSINAKAKLPYLCACGSTVRTGSKARHNKSAKHIKALEQEVLII